MKKSDRYEEEEDYYIEDGLFVMKASFHLKRGYCCGSRCRHCPYDHENVPKNDTERPPRSES